MKWIQFFTPVKSLSALDAQDYIRDHAKEDVTILDVRQPAEYEKAHLPGAVLIPLPELPDRLNELEQDKSILVY